MAENKEELKSLLMKVKEDSEKVGLKLNMANRYGSNGKVRDFIFLGSKISEDCDYSHEIKKCLLLKRKVMTNLDNILNCKDITLPTKVCLVKAMIFPVIMHECEN